MSEITDYFIFSEEFKKQLSKKEVDKYKMLDLGEMCKLFAKTFPLASDVDPKHLPQSINKLSLGYYLNNENLLNK